MHATAHITENSGKATVAVIPNKQTQEKAKGKRVYFIDECMSIINRWSDIAKRHKYNFVTMTIILIILNVRISQC